MNQRNTNYKNNNRNEHSIKKNRRVKRLQRIYRSVAILAFTLFLVGGLSSAVFSRDVKASNSDAKMKYYESIQIKHDESLWSLADQYMDEHYANRMAYVSEVASINGIGMNDKLICGEYLVVPYFK